MPVVPVAASPSQYATPTDLANVGALPAFVQSLTTAQMVEALQTASDMCDIYLSQRFTLPLIQSSPALVQACCQIAIYNLVAARGYNPNNPAELVYETRYNQAIATLKYIGSNHGTPSGIIDSSPGAAPGVPATQSSPSTVSPTTGTPWAGATWGTGSRR